LFALILFLFPFVARTLDQVLPVAAAGESGGGNGTAAADNLVPLAWRSARLLEALLLCGGETACELGMRITMNDDATPSPLLTWLLRTLARSAAGEANGPTSARAATQLRLVQISLLRLLIVWHAHSPRAVAQTLASPANLFLFDMAAGEFYSSFLLCVSILLLTHLFLFASLLLFTHLPTLRQVKTVRSARRCAAKAAPYPTPQWRLIATSSSDWRSCSRAAFSSTRATPVLPSRTIQRRRRRLRGNAC
jgi:hypothetical protein